MRVGVVCPAVDHERANASTYVRVWLRTQNDTIRKPAYIKMDAEALLDELKADRIDGAIIQRNAIPEVMVDPLLRCFSDTGKHYVLDLDDDLLGVPSDKDPTGAYAAYAPLLERILESASVVTVSTKHLAVRMKRFNARVVVLPNRLARTVWGDATKQREGGGRNRALYMGTVTHARDLKVLSAAADTVCTVFPEFRFCIVGVTEQELPAWAERLVIPSEATPYPAFVAWLKIQSTSFDFAVAPLENSPFNEFKSPLKVLEYGGLGLPVVASNVPAYQALGRNVPGLELIENNTAEWNRALADRIASDDINVKLGRELQRWVFDYHSLEDTLEEFDRMIVNALNGDTSELFPQP